MLYLRIGEYLIQRVNRSARNARVVQQVDPICAGVGDRDFLNLGDQGGTVLVAVVEGRETRVVGESVESGRVAETLPHLRHRRDIDKAVAGAERPHWCNRRVMVAGLWRDPLFDRPACRLEIKQEDHRFQQ